jgi:hypothetical protein
VCETPGWTYHQVIRDPPFRLRQKRTDKWQQPSRSQRCTCHPPLVTLFAFPAPGSREAKPSAGRWTESRRGEMIARGLLRSNAPASEVMMAMLSLRKIGFFSCLWFLVRVRLYRQELEKRVVLGVSRSLT